MAAAVPRSLVGNHAAAILLLPEKQATQTNRLKI